MNPSKLLYIDDRGVSLTRFTLKVKKQSYPVKIISYRPVVMPVQKLPGMASLVLGLLLLTSGYVKAASTGSIMSVPAVTIYIGFALTMIGIATSFLIRERYALQITTSEGVKNVLTSRKKEYIMKIVHKLNIAVMENASSYTAPIQQVA